MQSLIHEISLINRKLFLLLIIFLIPPISVAAEEAHVIKSFDAVRPNLTGSHPSGFTVLGDYIYFTASKIGHGREIWRTNRATGETTLFFEIIPGPDSDLISDFYRADNKLFFYVSEPYSYRALWVTDGTQVGTKQVLRNDDYDSPSISWDMIEHNNLLYFVFDDGVNGAELWRSDGTFEGTTIIADINPGEGSSKPRYFASVGSAVLFNADDGSENALWKSDGTAVGTAKIAGLAEGIVTPGPLDIRSVGDFAIFRNSGIWRTDGTTAGTVKLQDGTPEILLVSSDGTVYFSDSQQGIGRELWKTDGTVEGTVLVKDINPLNSSVPNSLFEASGIIYFNAIDSQGQELWRTDGTEAGTWMVKDIWPGEANGMRLTQNNWLWDPSYIHIYTATIFSNINNQVYFFADDGVHGLELWRTDGTEAGTQMIADKNPGEASFWPYRYWVHPPVAIDGLLYFSANDGMSGPELWRSDGTIDGTQLLADIEVIDSKYNQSDLKKFGTSLLFDAYTLEAGRQLWLTDGTTSGTKVLHDLSTYDEQDGYVDSIMEKEKLAIISDTMVYADNDGLWWSNGLSGDKVLLNSSYWRNIGSLDSDYFFSARASTSSLELWKTDGSVTGTELLKEINSGKYEADIVELNSTQTAIFFLSKTTSCGIELWKSDGTPDGTILVKEIKPGLPESTDFYNCPPGITFESAVIEDIILFSNEDGVHGHELWRTDGTSVGTYMVQDIAPGTKSSSIGPMVVLNGIAYFAALSNGVSSTLWRSDGTQAGTYEVNGVIISASTYAKIYHANGRLYFSGYDADHGSELWASDGTEAGTRLVVDINPGIDGSSPGSFTHRGEWVYFKAFDDNHGAELWKTNGHETVLVNDINPGPSSSSPFGLVVLNDTLFFNATTADDKVSLLSIDLLADDKQTNIEQKSGGGSISLLLISLLACYMFGVFGIRIKTAVNY